MTRARRGSAAIELAVSIGVLTLLIGAMFDYGLYMRDLAYAHLAVREAARVGTQTSRRDGPETAALDRLEDVLDEGGFLGRSKVSDAHLTGVAPNLGLTVTLALDATPIVGLVTMPDKAEASITMRMQDQ